MSINISASSIICGFIFGVFGFAFFNTGRRTANTPKFLVGLTMMVYPYFITNDYLLWILGIALTILGFKLR